MCFLMIGRLDVGSHEAGQLVGSDEEHINVKRYSVANLGHSGHMVARLKGAVFQEEIDLILLGAKCSNLCCCQRNGRSRGI